MGENMQEKDEIGEILGIPKAPETPLFEVPQPEEPKIEEPKESEEEEPHKNRKHRRWESRLEQKERELIEREAYLRGLSERVLPDEGSSEMPPEWVALYGNTPEAKEAWKIQAKLIEQAEERATQRAISQFREEDSKVAEEQARYESEIDSELESLEDEFNLDLTSNAPAARKARGEFLDLVLALSPKDDEGNPTAYADFRSTFEIYQKSRESKPDTTRQKEIASRSMQSSSSANPSKEEDDAMKKYLKENGIRL